MNEAYQQLFSEQQLRNLLKIENVSIATMMRTFVCQIGLHDYRPTKQRLCFDSATRSLKYIAQRKFLFFYIIFLQPIQINLKKNIKTFKLFSRIKTCISSLYVLI